MGATEKAIVVAVMESMVQYIVTKGIGQFIKDMQECIEEITSSPEEAIGMLQKIADKFCTPKIALKAAKKGLAEIKPHIVSSAFKINDTFDESYIQLTIF